MTIDIRMSDEYVEGLIERKYRETPKVFEDGYSGVKISLVKNFVNCKTKKDGDLIIEGCLKFEKEDKLKLVEGVFYIPMLKLNPIDHDRKFGLKMEELERIVKDRMDVVGKRIEMMLNTRRWLFKMDRNDVTTYIGAKKGVPIKFPLVFKKGKLHIVRVPPIPYSVLENMEYEYTRDIEIYNHRVDFNDDVVRFRIYSIDGYAELVYVEKGIIKAVISSPNHKEEEVSLGGARLYLFTHRKDSFDHYC